MTLVVVLEDIGSRCVGCARMATVAMTMFALWTTVSTAPCALDADAALRHMSERTPCQVESMTTLSHFADYAVCVEKFRNDTGDVEFIAALDESQLLTFPYCSTLSPEQCRAVLVLLEQLLETSDNDTGDAAATSDTRRKRALRDGADKRQMAMLLRKYRKWRKKHGYGRVVGRWGRDLRRVSEEAETDSEEMITDGIRQRQRRAIFSADRRVSLQELLAAYKAWRAKHGYGKTVGRWGR